MTKQEEVYHPWLDDDWGQKVLQQKITKEYITNEDDALLKYPPNFQGGYSIVNQEVKNAWGYPKGYSIHPGYSPIHNVCCSFFVLPISSIDPSRVIVGWIVSPLSVIV
jgi:primary-amine oxidase